jgi:hypothetical protein
MITSIISSSSNSRNNSLIKMMITMTRTRKITTRKYKMKIEVIIIFKVSTRISDISIHSLLAG